MREITKYTETIEKTETISITCNRCGKTEEGEHVEYSSDIQQQRFDFGYGSTMDGTEMKFDLCDNCVKEIISEFIHQPEIIEHI